MKAALVSITTTSPERHRENKLDNVVAILDQNNIQLQVTKHFFNHRHFNIDVGSQIIVNDSEKYEVLEITFNDKRPKYATCLCKQVA